MTIWLVVGVPGTGHHLLHDLVPIQYQSVFRQAVLQTICEPDVSLPPPPIGDHFEFAFSFPTDIPSDTLHRLDLLRYCEKYPDVIFVVARRDPVDCFMSFYRRFSNHFGNDISRALRVIEDNLIYISAQLKVLESKRVVVVDYEGLVGNPSKYEQSLGVSFSPDAEIIAPKSYTTHPDYELVSRYFSKQRRAQWDYLTNLVDKTETCCAP